MARVDLPSTVDATEEILMPASWRTLSRRWTSWALMVTWDLRYRVSSLSSRAAGWGTRLGRTMPWAATSASHSASAMSVLRPGTFFTWRALTNQSSAKRPSRP